MKRKWKQLEITFLRKLQAIKKFLRNERLLEKVCAPVPPYRKAANKIFSGRSKAVINELDEEALNAPDKLKNVLIQQVELTKPDLAKKL